MSSIPRPEKSPFTKASSSAAAAGITTATKNDISNTDIKDLNSLSGDLEALPIKLPPPVSPIIKQTASLSENPEEEDDDDDGAEEKSGDDSSSLGSSSEYSKELKDSSRNGRNQTPPTRFIFDPSGPQTHDYTTVDVITVPCPGGHALKSWSRDGLLSRYFGAPSMRDAEVAPTRDTSHSHSSASQNGSDKVSSSWVRQGVRREADKARIVLYEHPAVEDGVTISSLAEELLEQLRRLRDSENQERPLLFMGYSVGGLVVKMALVKASRQTKYHGILRDVYGVGFFGTPHQGSSYFAMQSLAKCIQELLQLSAPLPASITDELRVGNRVLTHVDEDFKDISNDLKVWTFYETIDSRLSGSGPGDVYFTAPLTSIKSAILGMREEKIFPLQSDHANIASFGRHNVHTLRMFLRELAFQIKRADANATEDAGRWSLNLEQKVSIEVHGFFDDPIEPNALDTLVRAWSIRLPLSEFMKKGPDMCLAERLNEVDGAPTEAQFLSNRGRTHRGGGPPVMEAKPIDHSGLGIMGQVVVNQMSPPQSPVIQQVDRNRGPRTESAPSASPIPVFSNPSSPPTQIFSTYSPPSRSSAPGPFPIKRASSPVARADFDLDLAVDRLSPPLRPSVARSISRSFSDGSRFEYKDFPPFSQRSKSSIGSPVLTYAGDDPGGLDSSPGLPESVVAIRKLVKDGASGRNGQRSSDSVVIEDENIHAAFLKPAIRTRKFVWLHLPYNNPTWVKNILETLQVSYKKDFSPLYNHDFWATRHTRGRHSQHYAYFAKPGCYFTAPRTLSPRRHSAGTSSIAGFVEEGLYTCLFLPYLHFDSYKRLLRRRELILKRLQFGRARPIPDTVAKSDSLELQVIWEFLGHDPPINCRRTIDQFGYPSLRDTRSRDDDQMLYKLTKERSCHPEAQKNIYTQGSSSSDGMSGSENGTWADRVVKKVAEQIGGEKTEDDKVLNGNVLMVDQLWLWVINSHTVMSFFPRRESDPIEGPLYGQADLRDSIFNEVNVDLTRQCDNALDLAALAALHAVSVLIDKSSHPDLEVFRIFDEAISVLTENLTSSLKSFRSDGFRDKASIYDSVENKAGFIRARHREEGRRAEEENRDNTSALLELRDIEDELTILIHLFDRQSKVVGSMHTIYSRPELREITGHGRVFLNEALKRLSEYSHVVDEMIRRVRSTRDEYDKLLQMVQRQAQVDEVRLSRLHADLASAQSRSVMIFTIFTVIFLPLSFFTSLFGMNTQEWGGGGNLPLRTIGAIALPASFLLVSGSLLVAWSTTVRNFFRGVGQAWRVSLNLLRDYAWKPGSRAMQQGYKLYVGPALKAVALARKKGRRRRAGDDGGGGAAGDGQRSDGEGSRGNRRGAGISTEVSDFWERHRLERERGYVIPEVNLRGIRDRVRERWLEAAS